MGYFWESYCKRHITFENPTAKDKNIVQLGFAIFRWYICLMHNQAPNSVCNCVWVCNRQLMWLYTRITQGWVHTVQTPQDSGSCLLNKHSYHLFILKKKIMKCFCFLEWHQTHLTGGYNAAECYLEHRWVIFLTFIHAAKVIFQAVIPDL